ncbi:hypothetical protein BGZ80_001976 [Entomortierella chlamydospora]|uniref:F-box domain-containing protein n=1 Tax=Entomortierella chlamydospora TaxID=101097 RepID=A0A9P6SXJ1_9FUNG|nr:hypothetical protein BGZ79_001758 [Entomortierella chlamydospora]KAG0009879.1 hypothetical protein BGZ80_001976 [Entomortierella chlamydospora]
MLHPLELPEIRHIIGAYLGSKDLINCACVSKEWNSTFSNLIWNHLTLKAAPPTLTVAQIQAHSNDIRYLTLETPLPDEYYFLENLHQLHSLHVEYKAYPRPGPILPHLADLIENHSPSLRDLEIHGGSNYLSPPAFKAVGMCQRLKSLSLNHVDVSQEEFAALLDACANIGQGMDDEGADATSNGRANGLTTLCLKSFNARNCESALFSMRDPLSYLKHLYIKTIFGLAPGAQLRLLLLCPNIRSLYWRRYKSGDNFLMDAWASYAESGIWPLLTSLDVSGEEFHDNGLFRFIKSRLLPLEKFLVRRTGFGPMAYNFIISTERHYNHIQELDIYECVNVTSHMIQKVMTTMHALRYFSAGHLRATDILDTFSLDPNGNDHGQEWICKDIRTLGLCIDMGQEFDSSSPEYAERQRHVYRRLSELKFLEVLDVGKGLGGCNSNGYDKSARGLDFRLSAGLGLLASLDRIRKLFFAPQPSMALKDVEWMISTWKSLKVVSPCLSNDQNISKTLKRRLAEHSISLQYPT